MSEWSEADRAFKVAYDKIERVIEDRYGLPVLISDVLDPNTGDFDGAEIKLDYANSLEMALFVLAHLFGHTVQWSVDPRARELGTIYANKAPPDELFEAVRVYEHEASRLAMQLFHESGVTEFDAWLSDWSAADWKFLEHFYRTGERVDFRQFYEEGAPLLTPLEIPPFTPKRWVSRFSF